MIPADAREGGSARASAGVGGGGGVVVVAAAAAGLEPACSCGAALTWTRQSRPRFCAPCRARRIVVQGARHYATQMADTAFRARRLAYFRRYDAGRPSGGVRQRLRRARRQGRVA